MLENGSRRCWIGCFNVHLQVGDTRSGSRVPRTFVSYIHPRLAGSSIMAILPFKEGVMASLKIRVVLPRYCGFKKPYLTIALHASLCS
jgi:hypothetical protein